MKEKLNFLPKALTLIDLSIGERKKDVYLLMKCMRKSHRPVVSLSLFLSALPCSSLFDSNLQMVEVCFGSCFLLK